MLSRIHRPLKDSPILNSLLAWAVILCLAIANGAFRESVLIPALGKPVGLVVSGLMLSGLILLIAYGLFRACRGFSVARLHHWLGVAVPDPGFRVHLRALGPA